VKYTSDYYLHDFSAHEVQNASQIFDNLWNLPVDETQVQYLGLQRIQGFLLGLIPKVTEHSVSFRLLEFSRSIWLQTRCTCQRHSAMALTMKKKTKLNHSHTYMGIRWFLQSQIRLKQPHPVVPLVELLSLLME
jgi:hypothetical protein